MNFSYLNGFAVLISSAPIHTFMRPTVKCEIPEFYHEILDGSRLGLHIQHACVLLRGEIL